MDEVATDAPLLGEPVAVELMNTVWADRAGVHDALAGRCESVGWLRAVAPRLKLAPPLGSRLEPSILEQLRLLRDAARRLAADLTGDDRPTAAASALDRTDAVAALDRASALVPYWPRLEWPNGGPPARVWGSTATAGELAVCLLAREVVQLFGDPAGCGLRACRAPGCVLYFMRDHPRREWCSAGCGNRARVARHYRRHRPARGER